MEKDWGLPIFGASNFDFVDVCFVVEGNKVGRQRIVEGIPSTLALVFEDSAHQSQVWVACNTTFLRSKRQINHKEPFTSSTCWSDIDLIGVGHSEGGWVRAQNSPVHTVRNPHRFAPKFAVVVFEIYACLCVQIQAQSVFELQLSGKARCMKYFS